jgi:hypothetical protein
MGEGSSGSGPTLPSSQGGSESPYGPPGREPATQPNPVQQPYQPTYVPPRQGGEGGAVGHEPVTIRPPRPAEPSGPPAAPPTGPPLSGSPPGSGPAASRPAASGPAAEVIRHGPGVPVSQAGVAAESVWRTGQRPGPPPRQGRLRQVRGVLGLVLTVVLLAAAGVVVWLRFFDHPAFHVTGVAIAGQAKAGCGVDVTGRITTNGSAGTVSYQWVFRPQAQAPQPLNQSVTSGQHAVYVTVAVQGQGHGSATQTVTLDVLGPDTGSASADVTISC